MPMLTVEGYGTFDVPADRRLVNAIERDAKVDIIHACGGKPAAKKERLAARVLTGVRLSCQILCDHDMTVRAISRLEGSGRPDPGRTPEETVQPPPVRGPKG